MQEHRIESLLIQVYPDHETMSQAGADWLAGEIQRDPRTLVCVASGHSPTRTYEKFVDRCRQEPSGFADYRVLKLDEWGGLEMSDPATCEVYFRQLWVDPLNLKSRFHGFISNPGNPSEECRRIQAWLDQHGPLSACVLGLGLNGHLGFNEPAAALTPTCHVATLSEASLQHSMLALARAHPQYGLTLGMGNILQSRRILLLVSGTNKRGCLGELLTGGVRTSFPASFLRLHADVTLLCDEAAWPGLGSVQR